MGPPGDTPSFDCLVRSGRPGSDKKNVCADTPPALDGERGGEGRGEDGGALAKSEAETETTTERTEDGKRRREGAKRNSTGRGGEDGFEEASSRTNS